MIQTHKNTRFPKEYNKYLHFLPSDFSETKKAAVQYHYFGSFFFIAMKITVC